MHRRSTWISAGAAAAFALVGCVTINIYFPAAAAERAADRIIDEVWQLKPDAEKPRTEKPAAKQ
ncbi:MAG: hypothetical protein ACXWCY_05960 [Burkholderiales bacterium]|jgi:hypothetical protein